MEKVKQLTELIDATPLNEVLAAIKASDKEQDIRLDIVGDFLDTQNQES